MSKTANRLMLSPLATRSAKVGPYGNAVANRSPVVRSGPTSASAFTVGSRFLRLVTGVIDQTGRGVAQLPQLLQCGRQPGPLPHQHIQGRRNIGERTIDHIALRCECPGDSPQLRNGGDDVVPLLVENTDDVVEAGEQLADLRFTSGQRDVGVVDDVTDLPQTAS